MTRRCGTCRRLEPLSAEESAAHEGWLPEFQCVSPDTFNPHIGAKWWGAGCSKWTPKTEETP